MSKKKKKKIELKETPIEVTPKQTSKVLVLCGKSASGKDTLAKHIVENYGYEFIVSHTSRPKRPDEVEGREYYFVSKEEFEKMLLNNEFIECRTYHTLTNNVPDVWYYGIHKDKADAYANKKYIVILDIEGLKDFKKHFEHIKSVYIDVDDKERTYRAMVRHGFDAHEWHRRLKDDNMKFAQDILDKEVDFFVQNYDFDKCVKEIMDKVKW